MLDDQGLIPGDRQGFFSYTPHPNTPSQGPIILILSWYQDVTSSVVLQLKHEADHLPLSGTKVNIA
jgi:hypothetical protein